MGVKEEVTQRADYYSSMLQIQLTGAYLPKAKTPQYEFDRLQKAKDDAYTNTVSNLLVPYLSGDVLAHIVLGFMGPLRYQITYSVDMLPILHSTVSKPRKSMWKSVPVVDKRKIATFDVASRIEDESDVYGEFAQHIRNVFNLRSWFSEVAVFRVAVAGEKPELIRIRAMDGHNSAVNEVKRMKRLYLKAMSGFGSCAVGENVLHFDLVGISYYFYQQKEREYEGWGSRTRCWDGDGRVLMADGQTRKRIRDVKIGDALAVMKMSSDGGIHCGRGIATVTVKVETVLNRSIEMVKVDDAMWITPNHAVYFPSQRVWSLPRDVGTVVSRHQGSIFNFIVDQGHVINVDGVWAHTLGHEFTTPRVAHPIWGSSQVMREIWSKHDTYPNVVEQC